MWRFSDVCPGIVWRARTACTHTHMMIALHILGFVLQGPFMCAAKHPLCCKAIVCAAKQQTLTLLLFLLMLHGMFNATKTVIYCSYLPGYVGCIYDDDNGKMSRTLDCDVWKLFVTWK